MSLIREMEAWCYPIIDLVLLIFCLVKLRHRAGKFFAAGFGIVILSSLSWRVVRVFDLAGSDGKIYDILAHINLFFYLAFAVFFFLGIHDISKFVTPENQAAMQGRSSGMPLERILFSFRGRIGRATIWGVWVAMTALGLILSLLIYAISNQGEEAGLIAAIVIYILYLIPSTWISLAVQVKRWHDRGKTGWMVLINLVPLVGAIWAMIELGFLQGTAGPNPYGEDPLS